MARQRKPGARAGFIGPEIEDVSLPENYFDLLKESAKQQAIAFAEYACEQRRLVPLTGRPPHPALLHLYLRYAQPTADDVRVDGAATVEARRVKYVRALHTLWRRWKAEVRATRSAASFVAEISGRRLPWSEELQTFQWAHEHWIALGAPPDFDRLLQDFFDWSTRAIFASPDPLAAMRVFWEGAPRRGRKKETNAERNFDLALAVQKLVNANAGMSNETACAAVAETAGLSSDEVHKIYYRRQREVRVALAWVALLSEP